MPLALCTTSHSPLIGLHDPDPLVRAEVDEVLARARAFVADFAPDLVVVFAPDHYNGFLYDMMPSFCVGAAASSVGDYGLPSGPLDVDRDAAYVIAKTVLNAGVDVAVSEDMQVDHGLVQPLTFLFASLTASAAAHIANAAALAPHQRRIVDLTPAALGPFVIPPVNLEQHLTAPNINMVTCGGQATVPIVAAVSRVTPVAYAEIVATVASKSAGPGTRANIDEFTETTAHALESVGGARRGKAIIILNPAEPPLIMRDTVLCLIGDADHGQVRESIERMVADVAGYVPGYRLKQEVQFTPVDHDDVRILLPLDGPEVRWKVTVFLEVEGAAHYLPAYAGNLDIMTSAAIRVAERIATASEVAA